jgi:hypothetical protein
MKKAEFVNIICDNCGSEISKYKKYVKPTNFCCRECKDNWLKNKPLSLETKQSISKATKGEKNGMFGKSHTIKSRQKMSDSVKNNYIENDNLRYMCGNSRLSAEDRIKSAKNTHKNRTKESYVHYPSDETKKLIGKKSAEKFTDEYKIRLRLKLEKEGKLIPLDMQDDYKVYKDFANWIDKMFDHIETDNQILLLRKLGVFNMKTNKKGVVRDHIYSRKSGFKENVFPEILRHPCNCQIITHRDNVIKRDKDDISKEELFEMILLYEGKWKEHVKCLSLIEDYKNGKRYRKEEYLKKYYERKDSNATN